ncbi:hypothetical protein [Secundilactobacillus kimchicus]|uniref:hypothetical protein n=1 Tax=Secundilactobacillus kimchicus TaxID=528209 RepID=UPI0006D2C0EA|nr:hypothetical protein [Secundilactobacillus kimchicus]MBT9670859.1 hypothetical protein [Secundilactobacillus kimchicus]
MALKLNLYKKDDLTKPVATGDDATGAVLTGMAAGTKVVAGDYKATHVDDSGKLDESEPVDVPEFTVPAGS